jgi:hypothetical protein
MNPSTPNSKNNEKTTLSCSFLAYQESWGDYEAFPLFNIIGGERDGSTVALQTLEQLGIEVPKYPSYEEWRKTK